MIEDSELILKFKQGDSHAFDQIFNKYKNEAVRTAFLITGKRAFCEDIAQETFIKCIKNIQKLKNPDGFRAWFFKILTRTAWKYGKTSSREVPSEDVILQADKSSSDLSVEQYLESEANKILYYEINNLEAKQKTVIILYYFNGFSTKEIAKVTGCLEGTVKSRLFSARKKLRAGLDNVNHIGKECARSAGYKVV